MKGKFLSTVLLYIFVLGLGSRSLPAADTRFLVSDNTTTLFEVSTAGETAVFMDELPDTVTDMAFDAAGDLYVLTGYSILKIDPASKTILQTIPLGDSVHRGLAIQGQYAFTAENGRQLRRVELATGVISDFPDVIISADCLAIGSDGMVYTGASNITRVKPHNQHYSIVSWDAASVIRFDQQGNLYFSGAGSTQVNRISPGEDGILGTLDDSTTAVINLVESATFEIFAGNLYYSTNSHLVSFDLEAGEISSTIGISAWGNRVVCIPEANNQQGRIQIQEAAYRVIEDENAVLISLVRDGGTDGEVSVSFHTTDGSAKDGMDYVATNGVVTFANGESEQSIFIPILNDSFIERRQVYGFDFIFEIEEYFSFHISNPTGGATLGTQVSAPVTIEDNDGDANLIWRHKDGRLAVWEMKGTNRVSNFLLNDGKPVNLIWRLGAIADMNQDGSADFVWQRNDGVIAAWFMLGTNMTGKTLLNNGKPVAWKLHGATDWNHDSHPDLLWRHPDGRVAVWFMNQTERASAVVLIDGKPAAWAWKFAGVSDIYKHGVPAIFWHHEDGRTGAWIMRWSEQGLTRLSTDLVGQSLVPGKHWRLNSFAWFETETYSDVPLFRHRDGRVAIRQFDGDLNFKTVIFNDGKPVNLDWRLIGSYGRSE